MRGQRRKRAEEAQEEAARESVATTPQVCCRPRSIAPATLESEVLSIPDGASESKKSVEFKTPFAPAIIKVDPDVRMLQLRRKLAEWKPKWRRAALPLNPRASSIVATVPK